MGTAFTVIDGATTPGLGSLIVPANSTLTKIELFGAGSCGAYGKGGGAGGRSYLTCNYAAGTVINFYAGAAGLGSLATGLGGGGGYTWAGPASATNYATAPVSARGGGATGAAAKQVSNGGGHFGGLGYGTGGKTGGAGGNHSYGGGGGGAGGINGPGGAGGYGIYAGGGGGGGAPSGGHAGYHSSTIAGANGGNSFSGALGGAGGALNNPGAVGPAGAGSGGGGSGASGANGSTGTDGLDGLHGAGGGGGSGGYQGGTGGVGGSFGGGGGAGGYVNPGVGLDSINFGQFTDGTLYPNGTTGTTVGGVTFSVTTNYTGGFKGFVQSADWQGMFSTSIYGGHMIFNGTSVFGPYGTSPITLTFSTPIKGLEKVAVQPNNFGPFTGYLKAYNGVTLLGQQVVSAVSGFHPNTIPTMFFQSGAANVTKVVFAATNNASGIGLGPCQAPASGPVPGGNGGAGGIIFEFTTTGPAARMSSRIFPARLPPPVPPPPPPPHVNPIIATINQVLPPLSQSATLSRTKAGTIAQTLPALTQAATGTDTHGTRTGTIAQTIGKVTQQAFGGVTHPPNTEIGSISQTLPGITQSATLQRTKPATASQTLPAVTQAATGTVTHGPRIGNAAQTLPAIKQSAIGLVSPPPAPPALLNSVTYPIGAMTQAGFGQVRLSSQPGFYSRTGGLGLLQPGNTAATWTVALSSGTPGHWKIGSTTLTSTPLALTEGTTALTPTPTAAGVTAKLNGGPYVFTVKCTSTLGSSATATITINPVANAASFGNNDALTMAIVGGSAAAFQTAGGNSLLYSVGANRTTARNILSMVFTSPGVVVRHADPSRPGLIWALEVVGPSQWLNFSGITMSDGNANVTAGGSAAWWLSSVANCTWTNCGANYSASQTEPAGFPAIRADALSNSTFTNFVCTGMDGLLTTSGEGTGVTNVTMNGVLCRYFYNNAFFLTSPCSELTINDLVVLSPTRSSLVPGDHIDSFQVSNPPKNLIANPTINRAFVFQADGDGLMQGLPFAGGGSGWQVNGLIEIIKAGNGTTFVNMTTTPRSTFVKNFTTLLALTGGASGVTFTGGITSGVLTVSTSPVPTSPNSVTTIPVGYNVALASNGVLNGGQAIAAYGTGGTTGTGLTGTYSIAGAPNITPGTALVVTEDGSFNTPPAIYFRPSDVSANWVGTAGSFALSSGFSYGPVEGITNAGATGPVPSLVSVASSVILGNGSTTVGGQDCFTVHTPRSNLEAITTAQWAAMTPKQVINTVVANLLPRSGGPLDAGGGNAFGALTFSGLANDGSGLAFGHWLP